VGLLQLIALLLLSSTAFAADISQEYRYQVLVKETVNGNEYKDAIYYTPEQWENLKQADVDAEIQTRVTNYDNLLKNPPPPYVPTKAELQAQKADLEAQLSILDSEISKK